MRLRSFLPILLLILATNHAVSQTVNLTGTIKPSDGDSIELNMPFDGNYWKKNSLCVHPDSKGNFHVTLPCLSEKFILLLYKEKPHLLLLSPGRPLHFTLTENAPGQLLRFSGKAKTENEWIQRLNMVEPEHLSFIQEIKAKGYDSYVKWSLDSVFNIKLPEIRHSLDSTEQLLYNTKLEPSIKSAIAAELKFYYAAAISQYLGSWLYNGQHPANYEGFHTRFIDTVLSIFGLPTKEELDMGIKANSYLETYFSLRVQKAFYLYREDPNKEHANKIFHDTTGMFLHDLENERDHNEKYVLSTRMNLILPRYAQERHLANILVEFCMLDELLEADKLLQFIKVNCPESPYLVTCEKTFAPLRSLREQYAHNLDIRIRQDYRHLHSLRDILAPYKGKVVFVDVWGTWCPHCMEDMAYEPSLKNRLKGQDIVYLYIAAEEDSNDEGWKDFILINDMTGEHIRQTMEQIGPLWNELGVKDSEEGYPHYFIFDRSGNIVDKNAKRPSEGDALYYQLKTVIESGR
jgi:thiol-disulfide isomerase/thioredoxin